MSSPGCTWRWPRWPSSSRGRRPAGWPAVDRWRRSWASPPAERFSSGRHRSAGRGGCARSTSGRGSRRRSYPWRFGCCSARSTRSRRRGGSMWRSGSAASWARWPARPSPAGWRAASTHTTCWPHRLPSSSSPLSAPRASSPPRLGRSTRRRPSTPPPLRWRFGRSRATHTWLASPSSSCSRRSRSPSATTSSRAPSPRPSSRPGSGASSRPSTWR